MPPDALRLNTLCDIRIGRATPRSTSRMCECQGAMYSRVRVRVSPLVRRGWGQVASTTACAIGMAECALELLCQRADSKTTFGSVLSDRANIRDWIAEARIEIEKSRLLILKTAWLMDTVGNKEAETEIAAIKVDAPNVGSGWSIARFKSTVVWG